MNQVRHNTDNNFREKSNHTGTQWQQGSLSTNYLDNNHTGT
jgi:hypothetical protein